jgi:hypothetical protein
MRKGEGMETASERVFEFQRNRTGRSQKLKGEVMITLDVEGRRSTRRARW